MRIRVGSGAEMPTKPSNGAPKSKVSESSSSPLKKCASSPLKKSTVTSPATKPAVKSTTAAKSGPKLSKQERAPKVSSKKGVDASVNTSSTSSLTESADSCVQPTPETSPEVLESQQAHILLRYNHYREEFCIVDGQLPVSDVDERFCLSFAFPKCKLHLTDIEGSASANVSENADDSFFFNLNDGKTYWVLVEEDPEEAKLSEERNRAYMDRKAQMRSGPLNQETSCGQKKRGVDLLTDELKKLSADELREAGPRYQELLAARDLEDCLFS